MAIKAYLAEADDSSLDGWPYPFLITPSPSGRLNQPTPPHERSRKPLATKPLEWRHSVNESADLQEKIKHGADLVELGKENGHDFSAEDVQAAYDELKGSEEGLTEFELEAVSGGKFLGLCDNSGG